MKLLIQGVPLATEPGISLIILAPMKIFGQVKIPTLYMKNPFIQRRLLFGVGCLGGA